MQPIVVRRTRRPSFADRSAFKPNGRVRRSLGVDVSSDDPPTLLVHGDADALVDLNNSQLIHAALASKGVETDLVVIEGAGHGFRTAEDRAQASEALVGWFEKRLTGR